MSYYLLDHPGTHHYYETRRKPIRLIVVHTAEGVIDLTPPDLSAEALANYGATTTRSVSWHSSVDSDSIIPMLPDTYTAWHVRNYNSESLGVEIAYRASLWGNNLTYEEFVLANLSDVVARWCLDHEIPAVRLTMAQVNEGAKGIVSHATLDPLRRTDPGALFPWPKFLELVSQKIGGDEVASFVDSLTATTWTEMGKLFPDDPSFGVYYAPGGGVENEPNPTASRWNAYNVWMQRASNQGGGVHTHPLPAHTHPLPEHSHAYSGRTN